MIHFLIIFFINPTFRLGPVDKPVDLVATIDFSNVSNSKQQRNGQLITSPFDILQIYSDILRSGISGLRGSLSGVGFELSPRQQLEQDFSDLLSIQLFDYQRYEANQVLHSVGESLAHTECHMELARDSTAMRLRLLALSVLGIFHASVVEAGEPFVYELQSTSKGITLPMDMNNFFNLLTKGMPGKGSEFVTLSYQDIQAFYVYALVVSGLMLSRSSLLSSSHIKVKGDPNKGPFSVVIPISNSADGIYSLELSLDYK